MRRLFSIVLAAVLIITSLPLLHASATEVDLTDYDQLIALAKDVFPEYSDKITNYKAPSIQPRHSNSQPVIVIQDTRKVDDSTYITYTEQNDGTIALGTLRFVTTPELDVDETETSGTFTRYTVTLTGTVVEGSHIFIATDVVYGIYPTTYDRIISKGTYFLRGREYDECGLISADYVNQIETASSSARLIYSFPITVGTRDYTGYFVLDVQAGQASVSYSIANS